jgi:hypothetical protein
MALITHAARTLDPALQRLREYWTTEQRFVVEIPYRSGVLKPHVLLLRRTGRRYRV